MDIECFRVANQLLTANDTDNLKFKANSSVPELSRHAYMSLITIFEVLNIKLTNIFVSLKENVSTYP